MQEVVVIEKTNVFSPRQIEGLVVRGADAGVCEELHPHPPAGATEQLQQLPGFTVLRAVIDDAPFPIGERLIEKAQGCFGQPFRL